MNTSSPSIAPNTSAVIVSLADASAKRRARSIEQTHAVGSTQSAIKVATRGLYEFARLAGDQAEELTTQIRPGSNSWAKAIQITHLLDRVEKLAEEIKMLNQV
jgi:hypothetical protein